MSTPSFGDKLRQERESRNLTLEEIAERTAIDARFLRALEQDEFDALPGQAFGKFYIRAYAEVLGFDPRTLIADYDEQQRRHRPRRERPAPSEQERPRRRVETAVARWREARERARAEPPQRSVEPEAPEPEVAAEPVEPEVGRQRDGPESAAPGQAPELAPEPAPPQVVSPVEADVETADQPLAMPLPEAPRDWTTTGHDEAAALASILGPAADLRGASSRRIPVARVALVSAAVVLAAVAIGLVLILRDGESHTAAPEGPASAREAAPREPSSSTSPDPEALRAERTTPPAPPAPAERAQPPADTGAVEERREPGRLAIPEFGVGRRVVGQRLEGPGRRFEEGSVVAFWTRVVGGSRGETIRHVWLHRGRQIQSVTLELGGVNWRTHSRKTLRGTGAWEVEARDAEDRVLARAGFDCVAAVR